MFSSKKDNAAAAAAAAAAAVPQGKRAARTSAPSIISADLVVNGMLTSTGDIQIDGRVEGDVRSAGLVIGDKAFIHGEVMAEDVTVRGRVQGSIRARKVLLCATSHVEGNILHEAFAVETGAFFEGNCRHADNPLADDAVIKKTTSEVRAAPPVAAAPVAAAPPAAPAAVAAPSPISTMVTRPMATDPTRATAATMTPLKTSI
jgi:cytoskeletal protein CcmA (bactofilin family)